MYYHSTQDKSKTVLSAQAIAQGISQDGGLFVPESFPQLTADELKAMLSMSYRDRAKLVIAKYLTDFTEEEIAVYRRKVRFGESRSHHLGRL